MKRSYVWLILLITSVMLVACDEKEEETIAEEKEEEVEEEVELLSDEEIKEIVTENLYQMEGNLDPHRLKELSQIVGEDIIDPKQDTEAVSELVETTKENLKNVVAEETLDEWTRLYLRTYYWDTDNYHLNASELQARFEVLEQSEEHFEVSYIMLKDTVNYQVGGTGHLSYVKENDHWVFLKYEHFDTEERPLDLTFADVEDFHPDEPSFEPVEEVEVEGVNFLVYKIYDSYWARNTIDSEFNEELAYTYYE